MVNANEMLHPPNYLYSDSLQNKTIFGTYLRRIIIWYNNLDFHREIPLVGGMLHARNVSYVAPHDTKAYNLDNIV